MKQRSPSDWRSPGLALLYIAPALVVLAVIFVYPLADAFWTSLHRWNLISNVKRWTGFGNYAAILADPAFLDVSRITFLYSAPRSSSNSASASAWRSPCGPGCAAACRASA